MSRTHLLLVATLSLGMLGATVQTSHAVEAPVLALRADASAVRLSASHRSAPHLVDSVTYVANHLVRNGGRPSESIRVARAIIRYAHQRHLPVRLVIAVVAVEDNLLNPTAESNAGALGVMQVMPLHVGRLDRCGTDLTVAEVNICYGTRLLRGALDDTGDVRTALLRYNGCVKTAGCSRYASDVLKMARLSDGEMRRAVGMSGVMIAPVMAVQRDDVIVTRGGAVTAGSLRVLGA